MSDALSHEPAAPQKQGLSRRQLVTAGAWAAPVVALTVATPAASASGSLTLVISGASLGYAWGSGTLNGITGALTVTNQTTTKTGGTVQGISVVVSVDAAGIATTTPTGVTANWTPSVGTVSGTKVSFTFTFAGTLTPGQSQALSFTLGSSGITALTNRAWTAASNGSTPTPNTSFTGGSAAGTVSLVTASPTVAPSTFQPSGTGNNGKDVVVSLSISANVSVVARLTVTPKHKNDNFIGTFSGGTITPGATDTADDVATTNSISAGPATITFPTYQKQDSALDRKYTLEFLINNVVYAPATKTGNL